MKPPYQRDDNNRIQRKPGSRKKRRGRSLVPFLIFGGVALFIAAQQFPWIEDYLNKFISPAQQKAIEACRESALLESPQPEFARIIKGGEAVKTQNGVLVENIVIGEMAPGQGEARVRITCHVNSNGVIANLHRAPAYGTTPAISTPDRQGPPGK